MSRGAAIVVAAAVLLATPARAQPAAAPGGVGRLELAVGPVWIGRASFGSRDANETTSSGDARRLFSSANELTAAAGLEAHLGVRVMRTIDAEASGSYTKPNLQARITVDAEESNAPLTIAGPVEQFTIGGAAMWYPRVPRVGGDRFRLFLRGGAGYLRQLENDGTRIVTGRTYEAGGGVKFPLISRAGWWKGVGARLDARAVVRTKGVTLDDRAHVSPAVGASVFVRF